MKIVRKGSSAPKKLEAPGPRKVASIAGPSKDGSEDLTPAPPVEPNVEAAPPTTLGTAQRLPTGIKRLDQLLNGGIAPGSAVLVYGPPFLGKEILARRFFQNSVEAGTPGIYILTNAATADVRKDLGTSAKYAAAEAGHLARYVDTYSRSIGAEDSFRDGEFLDGALDLNDITLAVNKVQGDLIAEHDAHAFVLDSISTLVAFTNAATAFRFLQTLIGRTRRVGATGLFLLDQGMHADADVQMFKHLMTGVIEVRDSGGKPQMRVEGLGAPVGVGWVDYKFDGSQVEITGSFAAGRIR